MEPALDWFGAGCQGHRETWFSTGSGWTPSTAPAGSGYFTMNDGAGYGDVGAIVFALVALAHIVWERGF